MNYRTEIVVLLHMVVIIIACNNNHYHFVQSSSNLRQSLLRGGSGSGSGSGSDSAGTSTGTSRGNNIGTYSDNINNDGGSKDNSNRRFNTMNGLFMGHFYGSRQLKLNRNEEERGYAQITTTTRNIDEYNKKDRSLGSSDSRISKADETDIDESTAALEYDTVLKNDEEDNDDGYIAAQDAEYQAIADEEDKEKDQDQDQDEKNEDEKHEDETPQITPEEHDVEPINDEDEDGLGIFDIDDNEEENEIDNEEEINNEEKVDNNPLDETEEEPEEENDKEPEEENEKEPEEESEGQIEEETEGEKDSSSSSNDTLSLTATPTTSEPTHSPTEGKKQTNEPTPNPTTSQPTHLPTHSPIQKATKRGSSNGSDDVESEENKEEETDDATLPETTASPTASPTSKPTSKPTIPLSPEDEYNALPEEEKEYIHHIETIDEEKTAAKISFGFILLTLSLMICTAQQMGENPDGVYANICRLAITVTSCVFKLILYPFRKLFGFRNGGYAHHLVTTQEFRDPYATGSSTNRSNRMEFL